MMFLNIILKLWYLTLGFFSFGIVFCDQIEENAKMVTFLAKELRSLHSRVESKISTLRNEINNQKNVESTYRNHEARKLYSKFREMKYQMLTLNVDIRQLFYEGLNIKTEMTHLVNQKTQSLSDEIANLRISLKKINSMLNFPGSFEIIRETSPSKKPPDLEISEDNTGNAVQSDDKLTTGTTSVPLPTTEGPLQKLDLSWEINNKLAIPCYLSNPDDTSHMGTQSTSANWYHNNRPIDPTEKRYNVVFSNDDKVSTLTIKKLKYKDAGTLECKGDSRTILLHVNLKVKEPCSEFLCDGACIEMERVCDKTKDCLRSQDEASCELLADVTGGNGRGTVVVLLNKMKGWVCHDGWNQSATNVLCRSLGYSSGDIGQPSKRPKMKRGFLLSYVKCNGVESSLAQCDFKISRLDSCQEIASVVCIV